MGLVIRVLSVQNAALCLVDDAQCRFGLRAQIDGQRERFGVVHTLEKIGSQESRLDVALGVLK